LEKTMGQARARKREIEELKRLGVRRIATPWPDKPVLTVFDQTWMILDQDFQAELDRLQARALDKATLQGTLMGLARMALWAERSGVKEVVAQNWYAYQQRILSDRIKQAQNDAKPVFAETRVIASKKRT
jgi:hypothetical protein